MSLTQLIAEAIKSDIDPEYDDRNLIMLPKIYMISYTYTNHGTEGMKY